MSSIVDRHILLINDKRPKFDKWSTLNEPQASWPTDVKPVEQHMVGRKNYVDWVPTAELGTGGKQLKVNDIEPNFGDVAMLTGGFVIEDPGLSVFQVQDNVPPDWLGVTKLRPEGEFPVRPLTKIDPSDKFALVQAQRVDDLI